MRKIISIIFLFIVCLSGVVFAEDFQIHKGWNLISYFTAMELKENQKLNENNMFLFNPVSKNYILPNDNSQSKEIFNFLDQDLYLIFIPIWYYSEEAILVSNKYVKESNADLDLFLKQDNVKLTTGWNLITINEIMDGKYLNDYKGNCNVEKVYIWDSSYQEWYTKSDLVNFVAQTSDIGKGIAIKVSDNCEFDFSEGIQAPPSLPSDSGASVTYEAQTGSTITVERLDLTSKTIYLKNSGSEKELINRLKISEKNGNEICNIDSFYLEANGVYSVNFNGCSLLEIGEIYSIVVITDSGVYSAEQIAR